MISNRIASVQIYRQLNIFVVLIGVEVWTQGNLINLTAGNGDSTMNNFLEYRRTKISPRLRNDNAQLIVWEGLLYIITIIYLFRTKQNNNQAQTIIQCKLKK